MVGGGAAGLSGALVLGRARRTTLVVDAGEPSNAKSHGIGGLLGHDQRPPAELYETGRRELKEYPSVEYRQGRVTNGQPLDGRFRLELDSGEALIARRVLLATGMQYCPPDIPGLQQLWGRTVFQCPFCHGWEMRDQRLGALASGPAAVHAALMLRGWSDDVVLLTDGAAGLTPDQLRRLDAAAVIVEERRIVEMRGRGTQLSAVVFADGCRLERDALLVEAPLRQHSRLAEQLGATYLQGPLAPDSIGVDALHRTRSHAVFAAGDVATEQPYVAGAIAAGSQAAMIIVQSLLADDFDLPYPPGTAE